METENALKQYGLNEKEIKIYLTLLPLGTINLQEIAKRVEFPRTTVYNTLSYLHEKGLVSKIIKNNVTYFQASDPEKLIDNLSQKKELLKKVLPFLQNLKSSKISPSSVEIYEGDKGLSTVLTDVFKVRQQTYYFGSYSLSIERLKHLPEHFRTIRIDRRIPAKIIIDEYDEEDFHKRSYKEITEMKFLNIMKDFPCMIFIYGNKVAIYTLRDELIGIIIDNKQVSQAMKLIFDIYWNIAEK
jgi:sugar-specific transcriptional regulator TrmB